MAARVISACVASWFLGSVARADEPLTVTAATGPHATPFEHRCVELRARDPKATCTRVRHVAAGGLVYEVFQTKVADPGRPTDGLWLAIGTEVGWFTMREPLALELFGGTGTGSVQASARLDDLSVRAVTLAGRPATVLELRRAWTEDCIECAPRQKTTYREITVVACRVGPVGVVCSAPLDARGPAPAIAVRGGALEVGGRLDDKSFAKGRYTIVPD